MIRYKTLIMKKIHILAVLMASFSFMAGAESVQCEAGKLQSLVADTEATTLTVTGEMNAVDFEFIRENMTSLTALDIKDAVIVEYKGDKLYSGRTSSPAGCLPEYSLSGTGIRTIQLPQALTAIGEGALAASLLTAVDIPAGVTAIGTGAFDGCHALTSATIPSAATAVGSMAFKGCDNLSQLKIAEGVQTIGAEAFYGCKSLETIVLPSTLTTVGDRAFGSCTSLENIEWGHGIQSIGESSFSGIAITNLDLSACDNLQNIGDWAFVHNDALESATLPASVKTLGEGVFFDCSALALVAIPSSLNTLSSYLLKGTALSNTTSVMTENIENIGDYTFYGVNTVVHVTLPSTLKSLGDMSMANMTSLSSVDARSLNEVPVLGNDVFYNTASDAVVLLASPEMADEFKAAPQWQEFDVKADQSTSADNVTRDDVIGKIQLKSDGVTLWIKSDNALDVITLYDITGRAVGHTRCGGNTEISVYVGDIATGETVIVAVKYTDGATGSIKVKL